MNIDANIIVSNDTKDKALSKIDERLKELGIDYEVKEESIQLTKIIVTLKLSKLSMIKHMFKLVSAPDDEIKYLCKIKSIVEATARDILNNVLRSIKG